MYRTTIFGIAIAGLSCGCSPNTAETGARIDSLFPASTQEPGSDDKTEEWTAALSPREFEFPKDHGAHEDYRIEWWYYTGNLVAENGRRFGYQLTFFRTGINQNPDNPSRWAVRDLYTAHFALSDITGRKHYCFQRNSRGGIGHAGAETDRYKVWNGGWEVSLEDETHHLAAGESDVILKLALSPRKPLVRHGNRGLSQKGPTAGNASHYYSFTRLSTIGTIQIANESYTVEGNSWMDHEFSTSFLEPGQLGWDWFSIQFDHGAELMLYRMRRDDRTADPFSSGTYVSEDGDLTHLSIDDFEVRPVSTWKSERTGAKYPLHWEIEIPALGYRLQALPAFDQQEMITEETTGISYWEGAIEVVGNNLAGEITGQGYLELTGYVGEGLGSLLD